MSRPTTSRPSARLLPLFPTRWLLRRRTHGPSCWSYSPTLGAFLPLLLGRAARDMAQLLRSAAMEAAPHTRTEYFDLLESLRGDTPLFWERVEELTCG